MGPGGLRMITAECHKCGKSIEVQTRLAQIYIMQQKMLCNECVIRKKREAKPFVQTGLAGMFDHVEAIRIDEEE